MPDERLSQESETILADAARPRPGHEKTRPMPVLDDPAQRPRQVFGTRPLEDLDFESGTFVVDGDGVVRSFDRNMERITGWSARDIVGRSKSLGFSPSLLDPDEAGYASRPLFDGELSGRASGDRVRFLSLHASDGTQIEAEVRVTALDPQRGPFVVEVVRILARHGQPDARRSSDEIHPLTGLPNAHAFHEALRIGFEQARLDSRPLSVLLIDVDGRDRILREYGDSTWRNVLRHVGAILQAETRPTDCVAHLDSERFAVLCESHGRSGSRHVGGQIRRAVESFVFSGERDGGLLGTTVSIGVACYPAEGDTPRDLMRRAEEALCEAHRLGHNRVWCYVRRPRVAMHAPVHLDGPGASLFGVSQDVSNSGMLIGSDQDVAIGVRVALRFVPPEDTSPIRVVARVSRRVDANSVEERSVRRFSLGLEFESFATGDRERLEAYLHAARERSTE